MTPAARLLPLVLLAALSVSGGPAPPSERSEARDVCTLADGRIDEASGIISSRAHPGCYYVHNDSGDKPRVFLIDRGGATRATIRLLNAKNVDYEDIALAPGREPGTWDVCVADIGDNNARRKHVTIYRFPEPVGPIEPGATIDVRPAGFHFTYADGPRDAEAFVVDAVTGHAYIITKHATADAGVYRLPAPWNPEGVVPLERIGDLPIPSAVPLFRTVTAADLSQDARRLVVRTYGCGWLWELSERPSVSPFDEFLRREPVRLALPAERQGEAICFSHDERSVLTVSEGRHPVLRETPLPRERP